jgi:hypothetical protein
MSAEAVFNVAEVAIKPEAAKVVAIAVDKSFFMLNSSVNKNQKLSKD